MIVLAFLAFGIGFASMVYAATLEFYQGLSVTLLFGIPCLLIGVVLMHAATDWR